jgi:hypothetical protein
MRSLPTARQWTRATLRPRTASRETCEADDQRGFNRPAGAGCDIGAFELDAVPDRGYPRPNGASPLRVSLVPAYSECMAPNRIHGPPLAYDSCNPPVPTSGELTVGTPDANGLAPASTGLARYNAIVGVPGGADDSDVHFNFSLTDVRVRATLADYTGELQAATTVRITDRVNGPAGEPATVQDIDLPVTVPCAATGGTAGAITTSFDAVTPGAVPEGKRAIWALDQVTVNDGGADGPASTTPNGRFAVQGILIP